MGKYFYKILFLFMLVVIFIFNFNNSAKAEVSYDLKAESISVSPVSPALNTVVTITAQVKNIGSDFI
ncbi:MAG: hypothetical protein WCL13_04065, partial [bacterium]